MVRASLAALMLLFLPQVARASQVSWVNWTTSSSASVTGLALVDGSTVTVTYRGEIAFVQTDCGTDYWVATGSPNPYVSSVVSNPPDWQTTDDTRRCDIIALSQATPKSLTFSQKVTNPLFAVVSLNGNGYRFDRDFDILGYGPGYWGNGTLTKQVTAHDDGSVTYDVIGTGEPHGVLRFIGSFETIHWDSLTAEYWNGFSIAVEHLSSNVPPAISVLIRGVALISGQASAVDFGRVNVHTSSTVQVTIRNSGTGPLTLAGVTLGGPDAAEFSVGRVAPAIAATSSTTFGITFTASTAAPASATVTIRSDDPHVPSFTFPLSAGQTPGADAGQTPMADAGQTPMADAGQAPVPDAGQMPGADAGQMPGAEADGGAAPKASSGGCSCDATSRDATGAEGAVGLVSLLIGGLLWVRRPRGR